MSETITITFCDRAENHVGMQQIGNIADKGFSLQDLNKARKALVKKGMKADIYDLSIDDSPKAYILVAKQAVETKPLKRELCDLAWDTKAFMYGRVVNKHARHNLCFGDSDQESDYEKGRGTVVSFDRLPVLNQLREEIELWLGDVGKDLVAEGNRYFDSSKCGIGYHGDAERFKVIGVRLGATIPLVYQWHHRGEKIGERMGFDLEDGDVYVMSEKAVGRDWKQKNVYTLRHAAGCEKYIG